MKDMCGYHRACLLCEMMPNRFVHVLWQHGSGLRESGCQTGLSPVQTCPPLKIFGTLWYKHITKGGPNCWAAEFVKVRRDATQWEGDTTRLRSFYTLALQNIQFNAGFKWFSNHFVFICISHSRSTFFGIGLVYAAAPTPLAPKARQNPESCDHIGLVQTKKVDRESSSMLCFVDGGQRLLSKKYRRLMDWFERVVLAPALSHRRRRPI